MNSSDYILKEMNKDLKDILEEIEDPEREEKERIKSLRKEKLNNELL